MTSGRENSFILSFIFSSAIYAVITPFLSILLRDLGYSIFQVGILLVIFEAAGIAGPFLFGRWADRKGNYRLLLAVSCILSALASLPLALLVHPVLSAMLLALLAFGFRSNTSLLDAATTIQIGETGNYGKIRVWGSISFVVVTLFLQWTPILKPNSAGNIALWITLVSIVTIVPILMLPGADTEDFGEGRIKPANTAESQAAPARDRAGYLICGFTIIFLGRFAMTAIYTYFPLYLTEVMQWDAVGMMFAIATATEVPTMVFSSVLIRRFGPLPLLALSATAIAVRLLILAVFPFKLSIISAQLLHSLCFGIFHPSAVNFIAAVFPPEKRGIGMSLYMALGSGLPTLAGNMAGGAIAEAAGYQPLFLVYAIAAAAAALLYAVLGKRKK
ncbi:MAG: MFS transporter [Treponema sp.]|nr:MFS transporter [Treponema sp.]